MRKLIPEEHAIEDFEFWAHNDLKLLKKIVELFSSILKQPFHGIGKPEALKGDLKGYWSRINKLTNRKLKPKIEKLNEKRLSFGDYNVDESN